MSHVLNFWQNLILTKLIVWEIQFLHINCGFALKDALSYVTHGAQEQIFVGIKQCNLVEIFELLVLDISEIRFL